MNIYSDFPLARGRQVAGDLLSLAAVILAVVAAVAVHGAVLALAQIGAKVQGAGGSFVSAMSDAAKVLAGIPLVGAKARTPFDGASAAGRTLSEAGQSEQSFVSVLAVILALVVVAIVVYFVVRYWVVRRIRFADRARKMRAVARTEGGFDVLAIRALSTADPRSLLAISPTVAVEWRRNEPETILRLAALELREAGVRLQAPQQQSIH
jgi:hypothetical protein